MGKGGEFLEAKKFFMLKTLHNIKTKYYHKEPFLEICEDVRFINNKDLFIKLVRVTIRYMVRLFGYKIAIFLLSPFQRNIKKQGKFSYIFYLINLNRLRLINLLSLKEKGFFHSIGSKIRWAEFQLKFSVSLRSRLTAKKFLHLLFNDKKYSSKIDLKSKLYTKKSNKFFYIFGPNSGSLPKNKYKDFTLVLPKPIEDNLSFSEKLLFLNSMYYNKKVIKNTEIEKDILKNYDKIFISCRTSEISRPFIRSKFPIGDNLCSSMGLGRILYNLLETYGHFTCVIEGFDFYLKENSYKKYYPSLIHGNEYQVVKGLHDHDALFNFLYVKDLLQSVNLIESQEFCEIMSLDSETYLSRLSKVRGYHLV